MKSVVATIIVIILVGANFSYSQNTFDFLRLDMSARAAALGGSFVSNNDDPDVIFYNPAGLKMLEGNPISISYVKHLVGINLAGISYSTNIQGIGRFGAAIKYINYGTFPKTDEFANKTGDFGAGEVAFIVGYSDLMDENLFYGANLKFIYSSIADRFSTALAADLGLHYEIPKQKISIGFAVLNLGSQLYKYYQTKEDLPLDVVIGVSKKLEYLPLRLSLDFHKLNEKRDNFSSKFNAFSVGAEFTLSKVLRLRFGYENEKRSELKIGTFAGLAGFNIGLGAKISSYNFDYGYSSLGSIGELHRISITTVL